MRSNKKAFLVCVEISFTMLFPIVMIFFFCFAFWTLRVSVQSVTILHCCCLDLVSSIVVFFFFFSRSYMLTVHNVLLLRRSSSFGFVVLRVSIFLFAICSLQLKCANIAWNMYVYACVFELVLKEAFIRWSNWIGWCVLCVEKKLNARFYIPFAAAATVLSEYNIIFFFSLFRLFFFSGFLFLAIFYFFLFCTKHIRFLWLCAQTHALPLGLNAIFY